MSKNVFSDKTTAIGLCLNYKCALIAIHFRHFGDLGSFDESSDGTMERTLKAFMLSLLGPFSVLGRAAVVS